MNWRFNLNFKTIIRQDNKNKIFKMIHKTVFIASGAKIIGDVSCGKNSSIWYNTTIRGDRQKIIIGKFSNIQDNCVVHAEKHKVILGDYVSIGHGAIIHGCTIKNNCVIGMGAILMEGAEIKENCIIGIWKKFNALIPPYSYIFYRIIILYFIA